MSDLLDVADAVLARAAGKEDIEVYGLHRVSTRVEADGDGEVRQVARSEVRGIGVRVVVGDRTGYASTTDLGDRGLAATLDAARSAARLAPADPRDRLPSPAPLPGTTMPGLPPADDLGTGMALARELARQARARDRRVRTVDTASWHEERTDVAVASTRGTRAGHGRRSVAVDVGVVSQDRHGPASGYGEWWGRRTADCDGRTVVEEAVDEAVALLGAPQKDPVGHLPVLLAPAVTDPLLAALGRSLTGPALSGRGPFEADGDDLLAATVVTLVDDGLHPGTPTATPFDDEGLPRRTTELIRAGRLVGALHSSASAPPGGESTGNARRGSHRSLPVVAPTTLRLLPAGDVRSPHAVVVRQLTGEGAGIRPVTGRIDVGLVAHLLRDGEVAGRLPLVPWSTTLGDVWSAVVAVGDDGRAVPTSPVLASTVMLPPGSL